MNKEFRHFALGDVFDFKAIKQAKSQRKIPDDACGVLYVVQSTVNNMVSRTVNRQWLIDNNEPPVVGNAIVLGVTLPAVSYQPIEFGASQVIVARNKNLNEKIGIYLVGVLKKRMSEFSYSKKPGMAIYKAMTIPFPIIEHADPNHEYTVDDIDWQYMEDRIKELEEDRIKELDAYLKVTNLDDYELTDEDRKVLSLSRKSSPNETDSLETDCQNGQVRFREFKIVDIFEVKNTKCFMQSDVIFSSGNTPYVTASDRNNSIMTYIECSPEQVDKGHCIFIGGKTLTFSYQDQDFVSNDSHNLALYLKRPKTLSRYVYMYMISSLQKSLKSKYYWGDSISNKKIQKDTFFLPITPDGEPDFDYMERYIRVIEKLTIANVVKYKDKVIDTTKMLVNSQS